MRSTLVAAGLGENVARPPVAIARSEPIAVPAPISQRQIRHRWVEVMPGSRRMCRDLQISHDTEVIAGPNSGNRFVEYSAAVGNVQRGAVSATSDHDVVDPPAQFEWHLSGAYERVSW